MSFNLATIISEDFSFVNFCCVYW